MCDSHAGESKHDGACRGRALGPYLHGQSQHQQDDGQGTADHRHKVALDGRLLVKPVRMVVTVSSS